MQIIRRIISDIRRYTHNYVDTLYVHKLKIKAIYTELFIQIEEM